MRKLLAVLAACFLLLGGAGCQFLWPNAPTSSEETDKHGRICRRIYRQMVLSAAEYPDAGMLRRHLRGGGGGNRRRRDGDGGGQQVEHPAPGVPRGEGNAPPPAVQPQRGADLYVAFTWDNPQFFFISNTYGLTGRNADSYDSISLVFTMNAQERAAAQRQLDRALNDILADIRPGTYE